MKCLINFGSNEYHRSVNESAAKLDFIGCFFMTELSHGSNVMELQTTATYDPKTKEFIVNTPTDRDIKIWIGNLAKDGTYGVLFAKLITQGKDHGVHPFLIQIRDKVFHRPLPGLLIGDMGAKTGYVIILKLFINYSNLLTMVSSGSLILGLKKKLFLINFGKSKKMEHTLQKYHPKLKDQDSSSKH